MSSWYPDWSATRIHAGPLRAAQIDLYWGYMGPIWVPYGRPITVYDNNSCIYAYIQPFGKQEFLLAMMLQLLTAVTMTIRQNPSMPLSRFEPITSASETIALTTKPRWLYVWRLMHRDFWCYNNSLLSRESIEERNSFIFQYCSISFQNYLSFFYLFYLHL